MKKREIEWLEHISGLTEFTSVFLSQSTMLEKMAPNF